MPDSEQENTNVALDSNAETVSTNSDTFQAGASNLTQTSGKKGYNRKCVENFHSATPDVGEQPNEDEARFLCNLCQSHFKSNLFLKNHLKASHQHLLPFKCNSCVPSEIRTVGRLNNHFSQHDQNNSYRCSFCEARFKSASNRDAHQRRFHQTSLVSKKHCNKYEIRRYACRYCDKRFLTKSNFERHERNHDKVLMEAGERGVLDFLYHCFICRKQYNCKNSLNEHLTEHADQLPYHCDKCMSPRVAILSVRLLNNHFALHIDEKPIKCVYCTDKFISIAECEEHERLKHAEHNTDLLVGGSNKISLNNMNTDEETRFQCSFCNKSYSLLSTLRRHENSHTRNRRFMCKTCGKIFFKSSCLSQHERTHQSDTPYKCSFCGKGFKESVRMIEHRRIHTGEKPFKCSNCPSQFRIKSLLKEHLKKCAMKVAVLPHFQCDYCTHQFPSKNLLIDHGVEHHSEHLSTEGKCKYCDVQFKSLPVLYEHEMQHRLPDVIECEYCGRIFKQRSNLRRHLQLHSLNAMPHKCDLCGKSFSQAATMKVHRRVHTGEKPYKCELCSKSFHHSSTRNRHKRSHFRKGSKLFLSLENELT
uniref:C2H2-type domain-containing protein n=1 Tax=Anopheles farauti TaxID=69004 RepID=A0A1Y9HAY2_9DIPT